MKKLAFALTAAIAATGLAACSEKAQDETSEAAGAVANDVETVADEAVEATGNAADAVGDAAENGAAAVEADVQDENKAEAKAD